MEAEEQGKLTSGMHLLDNPVKLPNGTCFMEVTDYANRKAYTVAINPKSGKHMAKSFADHMSVYDVIIPCTTNKKGQLISYLDRMIADKCYDFHTLPDSLVKALDEGDRLLVIHNFH